MAAMAALAVPSIDDGWRRLDQDNGLNGDDSEDCISVTKRPRIADKQHSIQSARYTAAAAAAEWVRPTDRELDDDGASLFSSLRQPDRPRISGSLASASASASSSTSDTAFKSHVSKKRKDMDTMSAFDGSVHASTTGTGGSTGADVVRAFPGNYWLPASNTSFETFAHQMLPTAGTRVGGRGDAPFPGFSLKGTSIPPAEVGRPSDMSRYVNPFKSGGVRGFEDMTHEVARRFQPWSERVQAKMRVVDDKGDASDNIFNAFQSQVYVVQSHETQMETQGSHGIEEMVFIDQYYSRNVGTQQRIGHRFYTLTALNRFLKFRSAGVGVRDFYDSRPLDTAEQVMDRFRFLGIEIVADAQHVFMQSMWWPADETQYLITVANKGVTYIRDVFLKHDDSPIYKSKAMRAGSWLWLLLVRKSPSEEDQKANVKQPFWQFVPHVSNENGKPPLHLWNDATGLTWYGYAMYVGRAVECDRMDYIHRYEKTIAELVNPSSPNLHMEFKKKLEQLPKIKIAVGV